MEYGGFMQKKIVTHPGSAHKDDFMATAILLATLEGAEVQRREATNRDLADPDTFLVDVGMIHTPELHNFDHHQDQSLPCAFHLVMQHLGYHEAAKIVFGWYEHMSMMDVRGPYRTAEQLGVDTDVLFAASSPIDGYILSCFSRFSILTADDPFYQLMKDFGRDLLDMIDLKKKRLELLKDETEVVPVGPYKALVSRIADNPKLSMELYLRFLNDPDIVISITPSVRGGGWELLRLKDNLMIDFRTIASSELIRFVHVNGFVAKTQDLIPVSEVISLAAQAINDPDLIVHQ